MAARPSRRAHTGTAADARQCTPAGAPIPCQPWDIGTGVRGYVWHAPDARAVLLLQHGWSEYAQRFFGQYSQLIPRLLDIGVSVCAFDMWGHGFSPGPRGVVDVGQAIEDHLAARRRLRDQPLPVFLLGHSMGGLVTAGSVVRDQRGVSGVVLMSPVLDYDASGALLLLGKVVAFLAPTFPAPLKTLDSTLLYHGVTGDPHYTRDSSLHRGRMGMLTAATAGNVLRGNWRRYPSWKVPVLVLHGTADAWTDPRGSRRFFETIASEDKTLHLVEGGYHELLNDTDRDETLRVLLAWLERRLPPGEPG